MLIKLKDGRAISREDFETALAAGTLSWDDVLFGDITAAPAKEEKEEKKADLSASNREASKLTILLCKMARQQYGDQGVTVEEFGAWPSEVASGERTIESVRNEITKRTEGLSVKTEKVATVGAQHTGETLKAFAESAIASLVCRSGANLSSKDKETTGLREKGAPLMGHRLSDIARTFLEVNGVSTARLSAVEITKKAMRYNRGEKLSVHGVQNFAFNHTTGSLPSLMLDAANKAMAVGFRNAPSTYQLWCRTVSIADFKNRNVVLLSEGPRADVVPEGGPYPYKTFTDARETYALKKTGTRFGITQEAIYNDDLDGITRIPFLIGAACRADRNREVYNILNTGTTSAQNMRDANPLFDNANHANNLVGASNVLTIAGVSLARNAMRQQTGPNGSKLNISPRFIIAPTTIETEVYQLINSTAAFDQENPATFNPFQNLVPVIDAELTTSSNPFYLAADPSLADTVEMGLLNGVEEPLIEEYDSEESWGITLRATNVYQAKAIDWRGMVRSAAS
jgi:hypothetical protein